MKIIVPKHEETRDRNDPLAAFVEKYDPADREDSRKFIAYLQEAVDWAVGQTYEEAKSRDPKFTTNKENTK